MERFCTIIGEFQIFDHDVEVPLDWTAPEKGNIRVFFREIRHLSRRHEDLPLLVFLQGGPGGRSPRPKSDETGWLQEALKHYRVILPDQRGTGRSSRVSSLVMREFVSPQEAGEYLACFDAHSIIADLEYIRNHRYSGQQWEILGQSYGGFLTLTYLSEAPDGLRKCYIAGGLPSLYPDADQTYQLTYRSVASKMQAHLEKFPGDGRILNKLADYIQAHQPILPNGDPLTVRRVQSLGLLLGMQDGSEKLHWLLEDAFHDEYKEELNPHFLTQIMRQTGMDENPLFAALHENIYAHPGKITNWAAQRQHEKLLNFAETERPLFLTGEMIYPWMFDEIQELRHFRDGARHLAQRQPKRAYYDTARLSENHVPIAAVIYFNDMYVDRKLSLQTANSIQNLTFWITNEYEHDGLHHGVAVFTKLFNMLQYK